MTSIVAIIPTKIHNHLFDKLLKTLNKSSVLFVVVYNNSIRDLHLSPWIAVERVPHMSVYQMWNAGIKKAQEDYWNPYILMLNDDIEFEPHLPAVLSMYLDRDPELGIVFPDYDAAEDTGTYSLSYTDTTAGAGGMSGYCFMMRTEMNIKVDENLKLYWGDDDLVKQTIAAGYKIARVRGLPVAHAGSYTINRMDSIERRTLMEADRAYFNNKYGENREAV